MSLPKVITWVHVFFGVAFSVWAFYASIFLVIFAHEGPLAPLALIAAVGYGPLSIYLFWLRKRIRRAKEPNGELLLMLDEQERLLASIGRGNAISVVGSILVIMLSALFCLGLLGFQCYVYLRYGEWISKSWADFGWYAPQVTWVGAQNIIDWIADQNAGLIVLVVGIALGIVIRADAQDTYLVEDKIKRLRAKLDDSSRSE